LEYHQDLWLQKASCASCWLRDDNPFWQNTILWRMERQAKKTQGQNIYHASLALLGKS